MDIRPSANANESFHTATWWLKVAEVERSSAAPCWDNVLLSYASITVNDSLPKWLPHRLCAVPFGVLSWRVLSMRGVRMGA